ncbi:MAG TPA: YncE family protein [Thermoanaerobaculia bacterium]|nr:YncE family protein [Thermoanaerobaculia bacterium]
MKRRNRFSPILALPLAAACASSGSSGAASAAPAPASAPSTAGYRLLHKIPVGGEGGWDYLTLDGAARRLYVSRGTRVIVLDPDTEKTVGEIANTQGVHGVAIAPESHRGFTSNGRSSTVTIFDTATLSVVSEVKVTGENPDAILYDPASKRVFTFNGRGKNATALESASGAVAGTIPLSGKPETGVADGKGRVFVNIEDKNELAVLDSRALKVERVWPIPGCEEPTGLAMDVSRRRLFTVCHNKAMVVLDADSGRAVSTLAIGEGVDAAAFDPATSLAFASNGEGTLTVVKEEGPNSFRVVENLATQRGARTMALDEKTHRIFLATAEFGPAPAATPEQPRPRPPVVPGSFTILVVGPALPGS